MSIGQTDSHPSAIRRIGLLTGGGDAPGLNGVIRAVVLAASRMNWECHGIRDGFNGLLAPDSCAGQPVQRLLIEDVQAIGHLGGTILGSTNRGNPLHYPVRAFDGSLAEQDRSAEVVALCRARGLDALVIVGTVIDDTMDDRLRVTMIATGLGGAQAVRREQRAPSMTLVEQPHVLARTGTDNIGTTVEHVDYEHLDAPAVIRKRERGAPAAPAFDATEIPAFLRKQAD